MGLMYGMVTTVSNLYCKKKKKKIRTVCLKVAKRVELKSSHH